MAMMLRNENELGTLRCTMALENRKPVMRLQAFIGATSIGQQYSIRLGAAASILLRIPFSRFAAMMGHIEKDDQNAIKDVVQMLDHEMLPGAPLWLQIGQDSPECALIPWERIISKLTGRNVLRIPNFLRNPFIPKRMPRLAICVFSPGGKGNFKMANKVKEQLQALEKALAGTSIKMKVTLFGVQAQWSTFHQIAEKFSGMSNLVVEVAEMPQIAGTEPGSSDTSAQTDTSIWLSWMRAHFNGSIVDGVHFICPSYARKTGGVLVLPETPTPTSGDETTRSIGPDELFDFYDQLGCTIMGFSTLRSAVWADGMRMLAYHLSWSRPGAIYVNENSDKNSAYAALLRAIWSTAGLNLDARSTTPTYVHPSVVTGADEVEHSDDSFIAAHPEDEDGLYFDIPDASDLSDFALAGSPAAYDSDIGDRSISGTEYKRPTTFRPRRKGGLGGLLETITGRANTDDPFLETLSDNTPDENRDAERIYQLLELERARISSTKSRTALEEARDKGSLKGLDFLKGVLSE